MVDLRNRKNLNLKAAEESFDSSAAFHAFIENTILYLQDQHIGSAAGHGSLAIPLHQRTGPVGLQELLQVHDLFLQLLPDIGISHQLTPVYPLHHDALGMDIALLLDGGLRGFEGLVGGQDQAVGIVDQGVACDTGLLLVGLGEAAVDH